MLILLMIVLEKLLMVKIERYSLIQLLRTLSLVFILFSCMPEKFEVQKRITESSEDDIITEQVDNNPTTGEVRSLPQSNNFLQQGSLTTLTTLSLFADYKDTFLLRGNNLISFLIEETKTSQSNYCLVTQFTGASGTNAKNILVLSARVRSFYSSILNTQEYFLQIEPNNKTINQNDCLTVSLNNTLNTEFSTTNFAYSLAEVCPDCNINVSSSSLRLFNTFGVEISDVQTSHLYLNIIPAAGTSNTTVNSCSTNATCTNIGFNCCLDGQCVNHGEVKPNVSTTSDKYQIVSAIIQSRPELIVNYEDIYYICPEMVPTDAVNNGTDDIDDPTQQAKDLFTELTDIYNCLNPVIDEISICKVDFDNASTLMSTSTYPFVVPSDDITFSNINSSLTGQNISQIDYAGKTYFKEKLFDEDSEVAFDSSYGSFGSQNDDLTSFQTVNLQIPLPSDALNDTLSLYYKIDGSCEVLGSSLARCKKSYVQGQSSTVARSSDHSSSSQSFTIPNYADTSFNVIVSVGGANVPSGSDTWSLSGYNVIFNSSEYPIFANQTVDITYFVSAQASNLTTSISAAQERLNEHCACDPNEKPCNLKPVSTDVNGTSTVTSYACIYPDSNTLDMPLQKTVYLSAKSVPHKFFDKNGVNFNLGEIGAEFEQEGEVFEYTDGNNLKPNNISNNIGFNEIYGSMNQNSASPLPPQVIDVEKGKNYDLFVDSGAFSTCLNCGTDYYSSMQKIFPNNFQNMGGGYYPDFVESRRRTNQGDFNADDFKFGRACFVPATMIPWTHVANDDVSTQRQNRLAAQHFLFANGYNKDWYGFDYGSIIGSFDGVTWFSVGNQRRIKAQGNKLYLAVNAYFGDLTINNTFKVTINEAASVLNSGSFVTHDLDSDGAQCQKAHICETDEDCITNLGYEYTCQNVSAIQTPWPTFDLNGNELSGSDTKNLLALVGGSNGSVNRCVYRGSGAACEQRPHNVSSTQSYTGTTTAALYSCSTNTYCETFTNGNFNNRISRYAESPKSQNIQSFVTDKSDTFGLGARILGRPYNFYGNESVSSTISGQLKSNYVNSICIPGKEPEIVLSLEDANFNVSTREADTITGVGRTFDSSVLQNENYFSLCPATDDDGNYTNTLDVTMNSSEHNPFAIRNNLSTNSLNINSFSRLNLYNDDESPIQNIGYHKNTCLRAPGSKCFSDFECAPSEFIATKVKSLTSVNGEISEAEREFWEQDLVCGNSQSRYTVLSTNTGSTRTVPDPLYELNEHKCCRETNKEFTYHTQKHEGSDFKVVDDSGNPLIPGYNQDINDTERYSRTHSVYDKLISEPTKYPSLVSAASQPIAKLLLTGDTIKQYNTLHLHNSRMCCTGNWVRQFAEGTNGNGGGHKFGPNKQQNISIETFKPLSWNANNIPAINTFPSTAGYDPTLLPFTCTPEDIFTADCEIKNLTEGSSEEMLYLNWFAKLELLGIPQVIIETNDTVFMPLAAEDKDYDGDGTDEVAQSDISSLKVPLENTIKDVNTDGTADLSYNGKDYYAGSSYDNFEMGSSKMKKVFSEDSFNCCVPTGFGVDENEPASACCSGYKESSDDPSIAPGQQKCCLQDFTDVSIYTNRYVSSEGASFNGQEISDSDIDPETGYLRKEIVMEMAKTMCCSGRAIFGKAVGNYLTPVNFDQQYQNNTTRRWLYLETLDDFTESCGGVTKFRAGAKWNDHVYCVPAEVADESCEGGGVSGGSSSGNSGSVTVE